MDGPSLFQFGTIILRTSFSVLTLNETHLVELVGCELDCFLLPCQKTKKTFSFFRRGNIVCRDHPLKMWITSVKNDCLFIDSLQEK